MNSFHLPTFEASIDEIKSFFHSRPVKNMKIEDIINEAQHWENELNNLRKQLAKEGKEKPGAKGARWGGGVVTIASFPAAFAIPPVGLAVATVGGAAFLYGEYHRRKAKKAAEAINKKYEPIDERKKELREEQDRRTLNLMQVVNPDLT